MVNKVLVSVVALGLVFGSVNGAQRRLKMKPLPFELGVKASYLLDDGPDSFSLGSELLFEAVSRILFLRADFLELRFASGQNTLTFNTGESIDGFLALPVSQSFVPYGYAGFGFTVAGADAAYNLRGGLGANILIARGVKLFGEGGVIVAGNGSAATSFKFGGGVRFGK